MIQSVKKSFYTAISRYFSHAVLTDGCLKSSLLPFRCLFIDNTSLMQYLWPKIYESTPTVIRRWRLWIPSLAAYLRNTSVHLDMCIAVLPHNYDKLLGNYYLFKSHEYVRQIIDTTGSWDDVKKRLHRNKRYFCNNLDRHNAFTHRISRDPRDLSFFYAHMFVPHVRARYGKLSRMDSYGEMAQRFSEGFLLFVLEGSRSVAGALCIVNEDSLVFRRTGVLEGDQEYIKRGAQQALYYFMILYANNNGLKCLDTMKSRPFLNDGVYTTKREWGASVMPDAESSHWVYYSNPCLSDKMALCLERIPTIAFTPHGLKAVTGAPYNIEHSDTMLKQIKTQYYAPGLEGLMLYTPQAQSPAEYPFHPGRKQ